MGTKQEESTIESREEVMPGLLFWLMLGLNSGYRLSAGSELTSSTISILQPTIR